MKGFFTPSTDKSLKVENFYAATPPYVLRMNSFAEKTATTIVNVVMLICETPVDDEISSIKKFK